MSKVTSRVSTTIDADFPSIRETAEALPDGQARILDGQGHDVDPRVLSPVLVEFLNA
jgi:hypothetical protein